MRLKVIAGNLIAVLLLGLVTYSMVRAELNTALSREVNGQIGGDQSIVDRSLRLNALEFLNLVVERAGSRAMRSVFSALDEEGRRNRAFEATERSSGWFADPARGMLGSPDIVVVVDDAGKVLARNADRNRMFGSLLSQRLPGLRQALADGRARHDVWNKKDTGKMLHYAVAPIISDKGVTLGAFLVGYDLSNGLAKAEGKMVGRDVVFLTEEHIYSSTFSESRAKKFKKQLFGDGKDLVVGGKAAAQTALGGSTSTPFRTSIDGSEYLAVMAPFPMAPSAKVAYAVLANRTEALSLSTAATKLIPMLTVLFALVVFVYGFMVASSFLRPLERIEEDVLAVINGNTDLRLDTSLKNELGGLAYRINQLVNVFTGVSEGDGDSGGAGWGDSAFSEGGGKAAAPNAAPAGGGGGGDVIDDPAVARQLEAEPDAAYYTRLYKEYVAAKQAVGESVSNIAEDRFIKRLQGNEVALAKKHGCRKVRFQVKSSGNQVALQPVLIR